MLRTYKHEVRILVSKCSKDICLGLIVRGNGFDGAVSGRNCDELCERLTAKGYIHELRFASGSCYCGLTQIDDGGMLNHLHDFLEKLLRSISSILNT